MPPRIDEPWVDIIPPQAPPAAAEPLALGLAVLAAVLLGLGLVLYNRPRARAARELRRLARRLRRAPDDTRAACFAVRACLRRGLGRRRLRTVPMSGREADWAAYRATLRDACFAPRPPAPAAVQALIEDARDWLRRGTPKA